MIDLSKAGLRCHPVTPILLPSGETLSRDIYGTILNEMENIGRTILTVKWDIGVISTMFPHDLAVEEPERR